MTSYTPGSPVIKGRVTVVDRSTDTTHVVEVSTSSIPRRPETCLFWGGNRGHNKSEVVEVYADWDEARKGHAKWMNDPHAVAMVLIEHEARRS